MIKLDDFSGFLAYSEICRLMKEGGWAQRRDSDGNPYIVKGDQWIGYDTVATVKRKMDFVLKSGLGGAMIWAIDLDDYRYLSQYFDLQLIPHCYFLGATVDQNGLFFPR